MSVEYDADRQRQGGGGPRRVTATTRASWKGHADVVPHAVHASPGAARLVLAQGQGTPVMVRDIPKATDGMLDTISDLIRGRDTAHQEIIHFLMQHPEHASNIHLIRARISLL